MPRLFKRLLNGRPPLPWKAVAALNGLAAIGYVIVGLRSHDLTQIGTTVFSSVDAGTYRQVADWIFRSGPQTAAVAQRPFLYPVVVGLADRAAGATGVWLINFVLWLAALNITSLAVYRYVGRAWAAALTFLVMATNISLIILTFHALAETLTVALLAVWAYGLAHVTARITPIQAAWALLPLTLLVVTKPEFELLLGLMLAVVIFLLGRSPARAAVMVVIALCLIPVVAQIALMVAFNHYFGLSEVGDGTIRAYYMARLYAAIAHTTDIEAQRPLTAQLSTTALLYVIASHPYQAIAVLLTTLRENLLSGSNFVGGSNPTLQAMIVLTNRVYAVALVVIAPLAALAIWIRRDGRLVLLCAGVLNVLLTGSLSFWQGDRLTVIALPLWLAALALAAAQAAPTLSRLASRYRAPMRKAA